MRRNRLPLFFLLLGVALIVGGIVYGTKTGQVTYQKYRQGASGAIAHYLYDTGDSNEHRGYLEMENSQELFLVHEQNFTPAIKQGDTFRDGDVISFIYDPSTTTNIDVKSSLSHLQGDASEVVEITFLSDNGQTEYTTDAYRTAHQGYYKNNWPAGLGTTGGGVVLLLFGLFLFRRRRAAVVQLPMKQGPAMPMGPQQPYQPVANYNGSTDQPRYDGPPSQYPSQGGQPSWPGQYPPQQGQPSQPGFYPPQQQGQPSQPGFYPPQQGQPSQPGYYPPQQGQPSQPGFYPPQQGQPSQPGFYPPQQQGQPSQPGTQYPPYQPRQD